MSSSHTVWLHIFSVVEALICTVGPTLNGIVCFTFCKNPRLLTSHNMFIFTITLSDFLMSLAAIPMALIANILHRWPFGSVGCEIHAFLVFQFGLASITHLTAATVEKYLTISKSLTESSFFSKRQTLLVIAGLWVYTLAFSVSPFLGLSKFGQEGLNASCSIKWDTKSTKEHVYFSFVFIGCFIVPVLLICGCNVRLLQFMRRMRLEMMHQGGNSQMVRSFYRSEKKALCRLGLMVVAFLVAWSPYAVVSLILITRGASSIPHPGIISMTAVFAKTSCVYNSFVNILSYKRLRKLVRDSLPFLRSSNQIVPISLNLQ